MRSLRRKGKKKERKKNRAKAIKGKLVVEMQMANKFMKSDQFH